MSQFPPNEPSQPGYGQWQQQPPQQGYNQPQWPQQQQNYEQPQQWQGYQQPQGYPSQQPMYQPPQKKSRKGLFIVLGVLAALLVFGCIGTFAIINAGANSAQHALDTASTQVANAGTPQSTQPAQNNTGSGKWTTVKTFSGNGIQKTAIFTVPGDWKILYSCTYQSVSGVSVEGALAVTVYDQNNTPLDVAVNATCKTGVAHTTGATEEHQAGQVYLSIDATSDWSLQIQELK